MFFLILGAVCVAFLLLLWLPRIPETNAYNRYKEVQRMGGDLHAEFAAKHSSAVPVPLAMRITDASIVSRLDIPGLTVLPDGITKLSVADPFVLWTEAPLGWFTDGGTHVFTSVGPDGVYQFPFKTDTPLAEWRTSPETINFLYDPTNGIVGPGDVVRVFTAPDAKRNPR